MTSQEPKEDYEPAIKKAKDGANDEQLATVSFISGFGLFCFMNCGIISLVLSLILL